MKRIIERTNTCTLVVVGMLVFLACGCANLSAIHDYAAISSTVADNNSLTIEYVEWPNVQKRYFSKEKYADFDSMSEQREKQKKLLLLQHSIIAEYMHVLGQFASDEVVNYNKEMDNLNKSLKDAKYNEKELASCQKILKYVLNTSTEHWRREKIKTLVKNSNQDIQIVLAGLMNITDKGLLGDIHTQRQAMQNYYDDIISDSNDKAGITAINEWREYRLKLLDKQEKIIKAYSLALQKIAEGHQKLYEGISANNFPSKKLLKQLK